MNETAIAYLSQYRDSLKQSIERYESYIKSQLDNIKEAQSELDKAKINIEQVEIAITLLG